MGCASSKKDLVLDDIFKETEENLKDIAALLRSPPEDWPQNLKDACLLLPDMLTSLTEVALDGARSSVLAKSVAATFLDTEMEHVSACCKQISLDASVMNTKWNKWYGKGKGETSWRGKISDGRSRGGVPYFSPDGWARFALNVCPDSEFEDKFKDFGYAYHGTNSRNVGSILSSGLRGTKGCFCAEGEKFVYMSPSIEYCGNPRYAKLQFNPEIRKYVQCVLQCRVRKDERVKVCPGTMHEDQKVWGGPVDPNFSNDELEWLFMPNDEDPESGLPIVKDQIVCTGVMLRFMDDPKASKLWWSANYKPKIIERTLQRNYQSWGAQIEKLYVEEPAIGQSARELLGPNEDFVFDVDKDWTGDGWVAPGPFAEGGMRRAYYAYFQDKYHVLKEFNEQSVDIIEKDLKISVGDAAAKDVCCQLLAISLSRGFNEALCRLKRDDLQISYVRPKTVRRETKDGPVWYYAEEFMEGQFEKYNSNNGWVSKSKTGASQLAAAFCHYTYCQTNHKAMVVDIQGCGLKWTDPQIHTDVVNRKDVLFARYSLGNHGKAGMKRFFKTHQCNKVCKALKLPPAPQ